MRARAVLLLTTMIFVLVGTATAGTTPYPRSKPPSQMPLVQRAHWQKSALAHYRGIVRAWLRHRDSHDPTGSLLELNAAQMVKPPICKASGVRMPYGVCWYASAARWMAKEVKETEAAVARLEAARQHAREAAWLASSSWQAATQVAERAFPGTSGWLLSCSSSEGGWGSWVSNSQGSGAGGWMQFMSGTFYGNVVRAFAEARARGLAVPDSAQNWSSPVGQAITAAYMRYHGIDRGQWTGARC